VGGMWVAVSENVKKYFVELSCIDAPLPQGAAHQGDRGSIPADLRSVPNPV
jgi:hypothetical protein